MHKTKSVINNTEQIKLTIKMLSVIKNKKLVTSACKMLFSKINPSKNPENLKIEKPMKTIAPEQEREEQIQYNKNFLSDKNNKNERIKQTAKQMTDDKIIRFLAFKV